MNIASLFRQGRTVFSCEIFPPKKTSPVTTIYKTLDGLREIRPDYISVTFGAGGNTADVHQTTLEIAQLIQEQYRIPAVAHLSCVNFDREEVSGLLSELKAAGVENVLALRGDRIPGRESRTDFQYASQLVEYIRREDPFFHVCGACYPEGHPESPDLLADTRNLKTKVDAGAEFLISQLFFDDEDFYAFRDRTALAGIDVPIEAGIMPVLSRKSIERMVSLCGASIPRKLARICSRYGDDPEAMRQAGIDYAVDQISDLIAAGADGIHLYTMNNPDVVREIADRVSALRRF